MSDAPLPRGAYPHVTALTTRWMDNDAYGHLNNVVYYSLFDTAVNAWLVERGLLDVLHSPVFGVVAETGCRYFASVAFPDRLEAGLRVDRLGATSVRYRIGIFREGEAAPAAEGFFVHVYVDRETRRPAPVPDPVRAALGELQR